MSAIWKVTGDHKAGQNRRDEVQRSVARSRLNEVLVGYAVNSKLDKIPTTRHGIRELTVHKTKYLLPDMV